MDPPSIDEPCVKGLGETLGLEFGPEQLQGVMHNFRIIAQFAALLNEFPLDAEIESATVFHLCSRMTQE